MESHVPNGFDPCPPLLSWVALYFHRRRWRFSVGTSPGRDGRSSSFAERINMIYSSSWMWDAACFWLIVDKRTMVTKHRILFAFQLEHNNQRISAPRCKYSNLSRCWLPTCLCLFSFVFESAFRTWILIN